MRILKIKEYEVLLDDEDYEKFHIMQLFVEKIRGALFVRTGRPGRHLLQRLILNFPKPRIGFLDNDRLNLQKTNLVLLDEDWKEQQHKEWTIRNRSKLREMATSYYHEHKEMARKRAKEYEKSARGKRVLNEGKRKVKSRYRRGRYEAARRGKDFTISFEEYVVLIMQPCYYSGESLHGEVGIGLDRLDNEKGYTLDNVVPCKGWCNVMRNTRLTVEETKVAAQAVVEFRKKKVA
jgi:hypothetical protein